MSTMRLLSIKDLCVLAGISRRTVYRIRAAGQLPASVRIGSRMRWRPEDIERWLQTRESASPEPVGAGGSFR